MSTAATAATAMDRKAAHAAAAIAATMSVRNGWACTCPKLGASKTPARPATKLEITHATATTPPALTPSSCTSRRLSTAPRICSPSGVNRIITPMANNTRAVKTMALMSSPLRGAPARVK